MIINNTKQIRRISAKPKNIANIKKYILDTVNVTCDGNEVFSVRSLFGGNNRDWNNTPLQEIYNYHISTGKSHKKAANRAGIDVGWLLKTVLNDDARTFEIVGKDTGTLYKLSADSE